MKGRNGPPDSFPIVTTSFFFIHQTTHQLHSNINNSSGEKEEDGFGDVFRLKDTCYLLYDVIEKEGNTSMILKAQHNKYKYKTFKS